MEGRTESRLANLMHPRENQRLRRYAALTTTLFFLSPASQSQWEPHPAERFVPLASRPAVIPLTATLESLSVSALAPAAPLSGIRAGAGVTLLTSWAIRANTTTLRLSGEAATQPDAAAWGESRNGGRSQDWRDNEDWPGISQPIGATNLPGNREDWFDPRMGRRQGPDADQPTVYILAQAL